MTKAEVVRAIYSELSVRLSESGFTLKKAQEAFVRPIAAGGQSVGVALLDYRPQFDFTLTFGVRIDAVEEVFHLFSGVSNPKDQSRSLTTISRLAFFTSDINMMRANSASTNKRGQVRFLNQIRIAIASQGSLKYTQKPDLTPF